MIQGLQRKRKIQQAKKLIAYTWEVKILMTALAFYSKEIIQKGKTLIPIQRKQQHVLHFVCMSSFYLEIIFFILITPYFIKLSLGFPPLLLFGLQSTDEEKKLLQGLG